MAVLVKNRFLNFSPNFDCFQKSFAAQFSTNLVQFSTTFFFEKKKNKMAVPVKKSFFQNFSRNFDFFQKSFAAQFSTNLAQFSTTFFFEKKTK